MKAFIVMFNRLTWPKQLAHDLTERGCEVILIDNGSEYKPLLNWYATDCPYKVHYLPHTFGHKSLWQSGIINQYSDENYIVTDHDISIKDVPHDFIQVLTNELYKTNRIKAGLSLSIDDLPVNDFTVEVKKWESKFWLTEQTPRGFYYSDIDTTLAVYSKRRIELIDTESDAFFGAVRSPKPYTVKHMPWYNIPGQLSEEEQFYADNIRRCAYWTRKLIDYGNNNIQQ